MGNTPDITHTGCIEPAGNLEAEGCRIYLFGLRKFSRSVDYTVGALLFWQIVGGQRILFYFDLYGFGFCFG